MGARLICTSAGKKMEVLCLGLRIRIEYAEYFFKFW